MALLALLKINHTISSNFRTLWVLIPVALAAVLIKAKFKANELPIIRLWQLIGVFAALYSVLHYPLMPPLNNELSQWLYVATWAAWCVSIASGALCFRYPALSLLPPCFMIWTTAVAVHITGLYVSIDTDIMPLAEVSMCIGLGLLVLQFWRDNDESPQAPHFAQLLLLMAIAVHLANYYWSFYTKMRLDGPTKWSWVFENNPAYLFLVTLDDRHTIFSDFPSLVSATFRALDLVHIASNMWVFACQALALVALLLPKRFLLLLLLMFDVMHLSIIVVAGANFWPWILLNVAVAIVVLRHDYPKMPFVFCLVASAFIYKAYNFVHVARLGWYDSGVNNRLFFEAEDTSGKRHFVPTNFFTFYSYSFGHMDYGSIDPQAAFRVGSPNGSIMDYRLFHAGRRCDEAELRRGGNDPMGFLSAEVSEFVRNYHAMALTIHRTVGAFPYDLYSHHFYVPRHESREFNDLDKSKIVAYIYRQETVCLSFEDGRLSRKVSATAEHRINVGPD